MHVDMTIAGAVLAALVACAEPRPAELHDAPRGTDGAPEAPPAAWTTDVACTSSLDALYATAPGAAPRGALLGCSAGITLDLASTQARLAGEGAEGVLALTGVRIVKLAYRTVRGDGSPATSTATAYLPLVPHAVPAPLVLVGRPTSGIADTCAPSRDELPNGDVVLPFAARGFVAVVPDFAGLGPPGVHAYLDNHEAVAQLFDAGTATRALLPGDVIGERAAAVGYSQGGGIVLSAQALERELTGTHRLRAVAAIAPEWPISTRSFGYEEVLRNPGRLTGLAGLSPPTVTVLRHYGFMANRIGASAAGAAFPVEERGSLIAQIESLCTIALGGALGANQRHLRDLVDETFRTQVLACIDGGPGCAGHGAAFHAWLTSDFVTADPLGARVLIAHGLADQVMPAPTEAACVVAKLRTEGIEPALCIDRLATHDSILEKKIEHVVAWIEAAVTGAPPPACAAQELPSCGP